VRRDSVDMATDISLDSVVRLNECAKTMRRYAFQVSLSALGAMVLSSRTGGVLKGFNEVALQMRNWSRDLEQAAGAVTLLTVRRVRMVSDLLKQRRLQGLLLRAAGAHGAGPQLGACLAQREQALDALRTELRRADDGIAESLDVIMQLSLMASVLSRAALIEAAGGNNHQRRELTLVSQEFASYAERVDATLTQVRSGAR
jgi:hypothetical protein